MVHSWEIPTGPNCGIPDRAIVLIDGDENTIQLKDKTRATVLPYAIENCRKYDLRLTLANDAGQVSFGFPICPETKLPGRYFLARNVFFAALLMWPSVL